MRNSQRDGYISAAILEQVVGKLMKAVVLEETVLSDILRFEREILEKAKNNSDSLEEFVVVNESVNSVLHDIAKIQMTARIKLKNLQELLHPIECHGVEEE